MRAVSERGARPNLPVARVRTRTVTPFDGAAIGSVLDSPEARSGFSAPREFRLKAGAWGAGWGGLAGAAAGKALGRALEEAWWPFALGVALLGAGAGFGVGLALGPPDDIRLAEVEAPTNLEEMAGEMSEIPGVWRREHALCAYSDGETERYFVGRGYYSGIHMPRQIEDADGYRLSQVAGLAHTHPLDWSGSRRASAADHRWLDQMHQLSGQQRSVIAHAQRGWNYFDAHGTHEPSQEDASRPLSWLFTDSHRTQ